MGTNLNLSKSGVHRTGTPEETNTSFISVSPNPTSGVVTVANNQFQSGANAALEVLDASGAVVAQQTMTQQQTSISIPGSSGDYFIKLSTSAGVAIKKVTKTVASNN